MKNSSAWRWAKRKTTANKNKHNAKQHKRISTSALCETKKKRDWIAHRNWWERNIYRNCNATNDPKWQCNVEIVPPLLSVYIISFGERQTTNSDLFSKPQTYSWNKTICHECAKAIKNKMCTTLIYTGTGDLCDRSMWMWTVLMGPRQEKTEQPSWSESCCKFKKKNFY